MYTSKYLLPTYFTFYHHWSFYKLHLNSSVLTPWLWLLFPLNVKTQAPVCYELRSPELFPRYCFNFKTFLCWELDPLFVIVQEHVWILGVRSQSPGKNPPVKIPPVKIPPVKRQNPPSQNPPVKIPPINSDMPWHGFLSLRRNLRLIFCSPNHTSSIFCIHENIFWKFQLHSTDFIMIQISPWGGGG